MRELAKAELDELEDKLPVLKEKLRDFPVKVQQHGDLYRVRIGLYSQRDEAEDVRRDLARLGFEAVIIPIN